MATIRTYAINQNVCHFLKFSGLYFVIKNTTNENKIFAIETLFFPLFNKLKNFLLGNELTNVRIDIV